MLESAIFITLHNLYENVHDYFIDITSMLILLSYTFWDYNVTYTIANGFIAVMPLSLYFNVLSCIIVAVEHPLSLWSGNYRL